MPQKNYTDFLSHTNNDWNADDDDDGDDGYGYEEDEDEFGLPSIASLRRKGKRPSANKTLDPGRDSYRNGASSLAVTPGRARSGSADIAEERGAPVYPVPKKSEGKILRPQYKEILRGQLRLLL